MLAYDTVCPRHVELKWQIFSMTISGGGLSFGLKYDSKPDSEQYSVLMKSCLIRQQTQTRKGKIGGDMKNNISAAKKMVKFESVLLLTFIALAIGFLGGIVFSAFKMEGTPNGISMVPVGDQNHSHDTLTDEQKKRIAALEAVADDDSGNDEVWIALGNACYDLALYQKAISAYETALKINPEDADIWTDLGVMYRRNDEPGKAVTAFNEAQRVSPGHEVSLFNKGIVMMHDLNDMAGAMNAWEELLEINPSATTPGGIMLKDLVEKMRGQI